jgi:pilus assembly protein CpaE
VTEPGAECILCLTTAQPAVGGRVPASILLISADKDQQQAVSAVLRPPAYVVTSGDAAQALTDGGKHDLLMLDAAGDEAEVLELCRQLRHGDGLGSVPLLCIGRTNDVEERIRFLEVGVDDFIGRPYDARELEARAEALVVRFQRARDVSEGVTSAPVMTPGRRRTLAVYSPKGGVGATTIAVNLAVVMAARRPDDALLVDLDLQFGSVAIHLDLTPRNTIVELVRDDAAVGDGELLRGYVTRHDSGLQVVPGPPSPEQGELVTDVVLRRLLRTAAATYGVVIVDLGNHLDERTLQTLEWADAIILPFHPEIPSLKAVHSLLDYLNTTTSIASKSIFVLNNAFARQALRMRDIELALGTAVALEIPYDPLAYLNAANEGIPVVMGAPRTAAASRLASLADLVFGAAGSEVVPAPVPQRGLGNLMRRSEGPRRNR